MEVESKSAVVVFARELVEGSWNWGLSKYTYLGVDFTSNGAWDEHVKRVGRHSIDLTAHRLLLISVVRPTVEYGSEVWEGNKAQAAVFESVMIAGCSSSTCNEAVRGDMGLDSLQGRRDKAKLKWYSYYAGASVFKEAGVECEAT